MTDPITIQQAHDAGQMLGILVTILLVGGAFLVAKNVIKTLLAPVFAVFRFLFNRRS